MDDEVRNGKRLHVVLVVTCPVQKHRLQQPFDDRQDVSVTAVGAVLDEGWPSAGTTAAVIVAFEGDRTVSTIAASRRLYRNAVILVGGELTNDEAFDCARAGADALVPHDLDVQRLISIVRGIQRRSCVDAYPSLALAEWQYIHSVLALCGGNRSETARRLGLHRSVLQRKLGRSAPAR